MERMTHVFSNKGLSEYNDDVFDKDFSLEESDFSFTIRPKESTGLWRFGIVLSTDHTFQYNPRRGRYSDESLRFIQINAGDLENGELQNPDKVLLQTFLFPQFNRPLETLFFTLPIKWIKVEPRFDPATKNLFIYFFSADQQLISGPIGLGNYKYFKLSAWADKAPFTLTCDIAIRDKVRYDFPSIVLPDNERRFLEIIYGRLLKNEQIQSIYNLTEIWQDFPPEFHPDHISGLLLVGNREITLLGIWQIDPLSSIFVKLEEVVFAIKHIFSNSGEQKNISSAQIRDIIPDLSNREIEQVFRLMGHLGHFSNGHGIVQGGEVSIHVSDTAVYEQYKKFTGLSKFMAEYLSKYKLEGKVTAGKSQAPAISGEPGEDCVSTPLYRASGEHFRPILGTGELAADLAEIINQLPGEKGQMVGIFGKWGRGKTTLLTELRRNLDNQKEFKYHTVEYHAWKYQETPASWVYLYETLAEKFTGKFEGSNRFNYCCKLLLLNWERVGFWPILKFIATIFIAGFGIFVASQLGGWLAAWGISAVVAGVILLVVPKIRQQYSLKAINLIKKYTIRHTFKATLGLQAEIQSELIKLLKVWIPEKKKKSKRNNPREKVLLIVEDLDRCTEERVIQNIDALRVMLEDDELSKRLIVVMAIDERILKSAIRSKYISLSGNDRSKVGSGEKINEALSINMLISEYLDKLFILAIKLGELNDDYRKNYISEIIRKHRAEFRQRQGLEQEIESDQAAEQFTRENGPGDGAKSFDIDQHTPKGEMVENSTAQSDSSMVLGEAPTFSYLIKLEEQCLAHVVTNWKGTTPRMANIFFFRYLLLKNLLVQRYRQNRRTNRWLSSEGITDSLWILQFYTGENDPELIREERAKLSQQGEPAVKINFGSRGHEISALKGDWYILFDVLELVVAY